MNDQRIIKTIYECLEQVTNGYVEEGSLAANIHKNMNEVGRQEGWLVPKLDTPLKKQSVLIQSKNLHSAMGVIRYWQYFPGNHPGKDIVEAMSYCADYKNLQKYKGFNIRYEILKEAASLQHDYWRQGILYLEEDRIRVGSESFSSKTFMEVISKFADLNQRSQNKDYVPVGSVSKDILELANSFP